MESTTRNESADPGRTEPGGLTPSSTPVMHVLAGPNGSGKTTFFERVIEPVTGLEFINADRIAAERWPGDEVRHGHEASQLAADLRSARMQSRSSFVTETVFSHASKIELLQAARGFGYRSTLHIVLIPVDLAVARVASRVEQNGHNVPEDKIRARYERLWAFIVRAIEEVDDAFVYDNSVAATPYRLVASFIHGQMLGKPSWPVWTPSELIGLT